MFGDLFIGGVGFPTCNQFGDMGSPGGQMGSNAMSRPCDPKTSAAPFPQPGGGILKISENGEVLPVDRLFVNFNHFHNALDAQGFGRSSSDNFNRVTLGFEKTFQDGQKSIEVRFPFSGGMYSRLTDFNGTTSLNGGNVGNVSLILKHLIHQDRNLAVGGGLGLELPTGDDIRLSTPFYGTFLVENEAFHLHPYLGGIYLDEDGYFYSSYIQFDFGLNDNDVQRSFGRGETFSTGDSSVANLLQLDFSFGKWIYRDSGGEGITGIAPLIELHYATTINELEAFGDMNNTFFGGGRRHFNSLNTTGGVHFEINDNSALRMAMSFPLLQELHRAFDAEFSVQYTLFY